MTDSVFYAAQGYLVKIPSLVNDSEPIEFGIRAYTVAIAIPR